MEQFVLSPVHRDIIAAQRRAAEMPSQSPVRVVHLSCRAGNINRGIRLEFSSHTLLDLGGRDLGGFCYC